MNPEPPKTTLKASDKTAEEVRLDDDLDLAGEELGERQGAACSMEPGCTSCE